MMAVPRRLGGHVRLGLVGYGVGGRHFHAPFIAAARGVDVAGVVTRSPERRAELAEDFPDVRAYDSSADLLEAGVDAVTITTPPQTRREGDAWGYEAPERWGTLHAARRHRPGVGAVRTRR